MPAAIDYQNLGPWPYYVGFTTSAEDFAAEMKRLKVDPPPDFLTHGRAGATTHFFQSPNQSCMAIICVEPASRRRSRECYASIIAHEAMHVVQDMQRELGELGKEAEAYLIQSMVLNGLQIAWKTGRVSKHVPSPFR